MVHTSTQHITSGINYMKIETTVTCTWPADDVVICQTAKDDQNNIKGQVTIGLRIDEVDKIVAKLLDAKRVAIAYNEAYAEYEMKCRADYALQLKEV